jgi:hypothetical protein
MLIVLIGFGALIYLLMGNRDKNQGGKWILGILVGALIMISGYNLGLMVFGFGDTYSGGFVGSCLDMNSGVWPIIGILIGIGLTLILVVDWMKEKNSGNGDVSSG